MNDNIPDCSAIYSDYLFTFCHMSLSNLHLLKKKKKKARNSLVSDSLNCGLNKWFSIMRFVIKQ